MHVVVEQSMRGMESRLPKDLQLIEIFVQQYRKLLYSKWESRGHEYNKYKKLYLLSIKRALCSRYSAEKILHCCSKANLYEIEKRIFVFSNALHLDNVRSSSILMIFLFAYLFSALWTMVSYDYDRLVDSRFKYWNLLKILFIFGEKFN